MDPIDVGCCFFRGLVFIIIGALVIGWLKDC